MAVGAALPIESTLHTVRLLEMKRPAHYGTGLKIIRGFQPQ
jgi:hypothetical protein